MKKELEYTFVDPVLLSDKDSFQGIKQQTKETPLLSEDLFNSNESCLGLIGRLSDPSEEIKDTDLMVLAMKYMIHYTMSNNISSNIPMPVQETSLMFHTIHAYFDYFRSMKPRNAMNLESLREVDKKFFHDIYPIRYSIGMLGDAPATAAVIRSIVSRTIDSSVSRNEFRGVDLGSGSGILGLAQYVMAKRNGFKDVNIVGIEKNKEAIERANAASYPFVDTVHGDTTKPMKYKKDIPSGEIHFITNENIPSSGIPQGDLEPFMINLRRMKVAMKPYPKAMFPEVVDLGLSDDVIQVSCLEGGMGRVPQKVAKACAIHGVDFGEGAISQDEVWKSIEGHELVPVLSRWYRRWGAPFGEFNNKDQIQKECFS